MNHHGCEKTALISTFLNKQWHAHNTTVLSVAILALKRPVRGLAIAALTLNYIGMNRR